MLNSEFIWMSIDLLPQNQIMSNREITMIRKGWGLKRPRLDFRKDAIITHYRCKFCTSSALLSSYSTFQVDKFPIVGEVRSRPYTNSRTT